ncbi:MAG: hypothetical protein ACK479_16900 [Fluviicola sp.]
MKTILILSVFSLLIQNTSYTQKNKKDIIEIKLDSTTKSLQCFTLENHSICLNSKFFKDLENEKFKLVFDSISESNFQIIDNPFLSMENNARFFFQNKFIEAVNTGEVTLNKNNKWFKSFKNLKIKVVFKNGEMYNWSCYTRFRAKPIIDFSF